MRKEILLILEDPDFTAGAFFQNFISLNIYVTKINYRLNIFYNKFDEYNLTLK